MMPDANYYRNAKITNISLDQKQRPMIEKFLSYWPEYSVCRRLRSPGMNIPHHRNEVGRPMHGSARTMATDLPGSLTTVEIRVRGTVQGVGFRPTVWRLARESDLVGYVLNDS